MRILAAAEHEGLRFAGNGGGRAHAQILLLGASAVGKTTLARSLAYTYEGPRVCRHASLITSVRP